jgi:septum formation topological specificity factor MinE
MYGDKDLNSEERLRRRIRNVIANEREPLPPAATRPIEDRFLALMRDYFSSSPDDREQVYREHEKELLNAVSVLRRDFPSQRSSSSA